MLVMRIVVVVPHPLSPLRPTKMQDASRMIDLHGTAKKKKELRVPLWPLTVSPVSSDFGYTYDEIECIKSGMYSVFKKSGNYIKMAFYFKILLEFVKPGVNVCMQFLSTESKRTWSWTTKTKFGHSSQQNIFHFWL
jgi:hypothetical protein